MELGQNTNLTNDIFIVYDNQFSNTEQTIEQQKNDNAKLDNLININTLLLQKLDSNNNVVAKKQSNQINNINDLTDYKLKDNNIGFQKESLIYLSKILNSIELLTNIIEQKQKTISEDNKQEKSILSVLKSVFTIKRFDESNTDKKDYLKGIKKNNDTENNLLNLDTYSEENKEDNKKAFNFNNENNQSQYFDNLFDMILDKFTETINYQSSIDETSEQIKEILKNIDFSLYENLIKLQKRGKSKSDKEFEEIDIKQKSNNGQQDEVKQENRNNNLFDKFKNMFSSNRKDDKEEKESDRKDDKKETAKRDKKKEEDDKKNMSAMTESLIFVLLPLLGVVAAGMTSITVLANLYSKVKTSPPGKIEEDAEKANKENLKTNKIITTSADKVGEEGKFKKFTRIGGELTGNFLEEASKYIPIPGVNVLGKVVKKTTRGITGEEDYEKYANITNIDNLVRQYEAEEKRGNSEKAEELKEKIQDSMDKDYISIQDKEKINKIISKEKNIKTKKGLSVSEEELAKTLGIGEGDSKQAKEEGLEFSFSEAWRNHTKGEPIGFNKQDNDDIIILEQAKDRFEKEMGKEKSESFFKNIEKQSSEEQAKILNEYIKQNLITQGKEEQGVKGDLTNKDLAKVYTENTDRLVDALDGKKAKTPTVVNQNNINNNSGGKQPQPINKNQYTTKRK